MLVVVVAACLSPTYTSALSSASPPPSPDSNNKMGSLVRRAFLASTLAAGTQLAFAQTYAPEGFERISPIQFIAALGDPKATAGTGAQAWGLWRKDPGPRGVWLDKYTQEIQNRNNVAPVGWKFDPKDWWLEEHGLIMESPEFPLPAGRYLVTGGRQVTTSLTIDANGNWKLGDDDANTNPPKLYDVTHLPCRSARYTPNGNGSPLTANKKDFPVSPGAEMPTVDGCKKQDYAVLFVIGMDKTSMKATSEL